MSQENVEAFQRAVAAYNRGDIDAFLEEIDPDVEWHPLLQGMLSGEATTYRGHDGVRELFRDLNEGFTDQEVEPSEVRDLDDLLVAIGRIRGRGKESGAEAESPINWVVDFRDSRAVRVREYLDPKAALDAAGLSE
jgi:ketosteroid isomerase-like protein